MFQGSLAIAHPDLILQIEALDRQIAVDPQNAELLVKRGDLHRRHQDYEKSARDFEAARLADPTYANIDFLESRLMLDSGQPERAIGMLNTYLSLRPGHAFAWVLRGRAFVRLTKFEQAGADFTTAIKTSQRPSPEVYRLQILSLAAQGDEQTERTLEAVNEGLRQFPYEVNLRGLGVDVALGNDRPGVAHEYLLELPEKLGELPQWAERIETAECLGRADPEGRSSCLDEATRRLSEQVDVFISNT